MKNKQLIGAVVIALIVGVSGGFWVGTTYGHPAGARGAFATGLMGTRSARFSMGGGLLSGTVASVGNGSLTLATSDGSSRVVLLAASTTIAKSVAGTLSDLIKGAAVTISGTQNSDGSILANLITLRQLGATQGSR